MFSFVDIRLALLLSATVLLARGQGEDDRKYSFLHLFKLLLEVSGCKSEAVRLLCDAAEINYSLRTEQVMQASSYSLKHGSCFPLEWEKNVCSVWMCIRPIGPFHALHARAFGDKLAQVWRLSSTRNLLSSTAAKREKQAQREQMVHNVLSTYFKWKKNELI